MARSIILISNLDDAVSYVTNGDRENTMAVYENRDAAALYARNNSLLQQMVYQIVELDF